ncbi:putative FERM domain-containing protein FRMD8P1 [Daphnia pulex]|uniref:putative FERM domain-containing protein FRMD8P1 n=1 Tax=Daphnia pulex TaxID=6669 RepID=UPI001EE06EFE|nr:putative FERM domain-containing protein FRMD8P1 [Daphnia pulex]
MDNRGLVGNHTKLHNSSTDFDSVHSNDVIKLMAISGYNINETASGSESPKECYGDSQHHSFVKVIPVEYTKQKFPSSAYNTQNISSQEDIRNYPILLNEKDQSEMSSIASVSTLSSHVMNRAMSATGAAMSDKLSPPRIPNGQLCVFLSNGTCVCVDVEHGVNTNSATILKTLIETEELRLPPFAMNVFALWMISPELEVQLKPHHKPIKIYAEWAQLVKKFTKYDGNSTLPEPTLHLRRNAFYHRSDEMRLRDSGIIELLYCEAKHHVLVGRYPCDLPETFLLGSLVARINLGNFIPQQHTPMFFRSRLRDYLPSYACVKSTPWSLVWPLSKLQRPDKTAPESLIVEQLKKLPNNIPSQRLMLNYLKRCWARPYYGAAFFCGQIEERRTSRMSSWFTSGDLEIQVAVSSVGVYLIEPHEGTVLLGLKYGEFIWDCALPYRLDDPDCFPCIFLQFASPPSSPRDGNDTCVIQIFSKQAVMVNALIAYYTNRQRRNSTAAANASSDEIDGGIHGEQDLDDVMAPLTNPAQTGLLDSCLTNKLHRLSLATFDDEGRCLISTGSLAVIR